jgi:thermostable 8-oxoguanine DNA glycosylase
MTRANDAVALYRKCLAWAVHSGYQREIKKFRRLRLRNVDARYFFREYAHVVLASGFRYARVDDLRQKLGAAFKNWDFEKVADNASSVKRQALRAFNNPKKVAAIINAAKRLASGDWKELKRELAGNNALRELRTFPYIGPVTQFHLARNIGLDHAKPDRVMREVAWTLGYPGTEKGVRELVEDIAKKTGERPGVVDYVLWECHRKRV